MVKISFKLEEDKQFWQDLNEFPDNHSKRDLAEMAKTGNLIAGYLLMKNHLEAIFREAMNPLTKEEVAIEMLGELLISPIHEIRKKAFDLLKKIQPDKISEKLNDEKFDPEFRSKIIEMIFKEKDMPLNILVELLRIKNLDNELKNKLVQRVVNVRQQVEGITEAVLQLKSQISELEESMREKFTIIDNYHQQLSLYGANFPANPKVLKDLKLDIEMAYNTLKEAK